MAAVEQVLKQALDHHRAGRLEEAERLYHQILQVDPRQVDALHLLGVIALQANDTGVAVEYIRRALRQKPQYARAHNNLGLALAAQNRLMEAIGSYREALRLKPAYADAHNNLGNALADLGSLAEAEASYREALRHKPDYAEAHMHLSIVLKDQGRLAEAEASAREALRLRPEFAEAHNNLANALADQGLLTEAVAAYNEALRLKPELAEAHKNLGMALLLLGDWRQGWAEYEWRFQCKNLPFPTLPQPLWDGSPLEGRTILLHAEQGLGDTLQFIRYAPQVQARGGRVLAACPALLLPLLKRCAGIDRLIPLGDPLPPVDVFAPLMSLPRILGASPTAAPGIPGDCGANVPYLFADPRLIQRWQQELGPRSSGGSFRIGIAWQGNPKNQGDRYRSVALEHFAPFARLPGVELLSLQKGPGTEQLATVAGRLPIADLGSRLDESDGAFMGTAAVMKSLDLVITVDTAIAHLAGALAVPVWVALPVVPSWRWLLDRDDSPWYPSMRLFRQSRWGLWEDVFQRMTDELKKTLSSKS
jgi:tetratricopeptide (TPR) repeat protein